MIELCLISGDHNYDHSIIVQFALKTTYARFKTRFFINEISLAI